MSNQTLSLAPKREVVSPVGHDLLKRRSSPSGSSGPDSEHSADGSMSRSTAGAKKKRTRTLTTAHQSAVLHALLARSRFPTTAMREEVGRSIGLSARKVQVWFQNQRQKARRTRGHSFGGQSQDVQSDPSPLALFGSQLAPSDSPIYSRPLSRDDYRPSSQEHYGPQPHPPLRIDTTFTNSYVPRPTSTSISPSSHHFDAHHASPPMHHPHAYTHPSLHVPERGSNCSPAPIHLPPLRMDSRSSSGGFSSAASLWRSAGSSLLSSQTEASSIPSSDAPNPFSFSPEAKSNYELSSHDTGIPPPFTLQPEPMWNPTPLPAHFRDPRRAHTSSPSQWDPNRLDIPSITLRSSSRSPPAETLHPLDFGSRPRSSHRALTPQPKSAYPHASPRLRPSYFDSRIRSSSGGQSAGAEYYRSGSSDTPRKYDDFSRTLPPIASDRRAHGLSDASGPLQPITPWVNPAATATPCDEEMT